MKDIKTTVYIKPKQTPGFTSILSELCQSFLQELEPLDVGYLNLYIVSMYKLTTSWCLVSTMRIP